MTEPDPAPTQAATPDQNKRSADISGAPPPVAAAVGQRYRRIRLHARGGLGVVYRAEDDELHREVALKLIRPEHAANPDAARRFVREAEITGRLQHPGIVPIYGLVRDADGQVCYAMRFVEGESLRAAVDRLHGSTAGIPFRTAVRDLLSRYIAVCHAIGYAHSRGVVHRDLKPENVMLGPFGETLVVDWGLAKPFGAGWNLPEGDESAGIREAAPDVPMTVAGAVMGTPSYMSPEQAAGDIAVIGPPSDVYCLGAILYAVLTGMAPFRGEHLAAVIADIRAGRFSPPRAVNGRVPRALDCVCRKAMSLRPEHRYPSAEALADDVSRWLADEPVTAYRDPLMVRMRRWERRYQWVSPKVMFFVLGGFVVFFLFMHVRITRQIESRGEEKVKQVQGQMKAMYEELLRLRSSSR